MKQILQLCGKLGLQLCCVLLIGCSGGKSATWQEEVELSNHRVIIISRTESWVRELQFGERPTYGAADERLVFESAGEHYTWTGQQESPLLLEVDPDKKEFVLITIPISCERYAAFNRPSPPYAEYRLGSGTWRRSDSMSRSFIGRKPNLLVDPNPQGETGMITRDLKKQRNAALGYNWLFNELVADGVRPGC